jgi:uncharacterized repeat protein (TIGR02543 family)
MNVRLVNNAGMGVECPIGFSWTTLFFGFLVPLSRGDWVGVLIHLIASALSIGIFWLIWPFFYNKNYIKRLLERGYMPFSEESSRYLRQYGIHTSITYESLHKQKPQYENRIHTAAVEPLVQTNIHPVSSNSAPISNDPSTVMSLDWPVSLDSRTLTKSGGLEEIEKIVCSFTYQNAQAREILYTQWQVKCFDILKKPILTEIPITIRHEYKLGPNEAATVKSSGYLPSGTRSFIPYLQAVLFADQTVEEFPENQDVIFLSPKMRIPDLSRVNKSAIRFHLDNVGIRNLPMYLHDRSHEGIWTCAFCGTRNMVDSTECTACHSLLSQSEHCTREKLEQADVEYGIHQSLLAEERRKKEEEEAKAKAEREEKARIEREEKERIERLEREEQERIARIKQKKRDNRLSIVILIFIILGVLSALLWNYKLKPMNEYRVAQEYYKAGAYSKAHQAFEQLGDYKDAKQQSLDAYAEYLETESAEGFRVEGYDWLLDNSYPKEVVFESFPKVFDATIDLEARLKGWIWLESKGYENAKERMYTLASDMVSNGRFLDAHGIYSLLGEFEDAQKNALALLRKVTFDGNGSDLAVQMTDVVLGTLVSAPIVPLREGYEFGGWWKDSMMTVPWDFQIDRITSDLTLFAKWIKAYRVGEVGPAGGYIFYDKGKFSDGWRYLEAASESYDFKNRVWGGHGTTVEGIGTAIGTGASNTEKIVARFGYAEPYRKKTDYAAKVCADLVMTKDGILYDDWFLPSKDELDLMYQNLRENNLGGFSDELYWSSSEYDFYFAWIQDFSNGFQDDSYRHYGFRVRPVRAF